jgi:outer membrane protein assembly factor BamB
MLEKLKMVRVFFALNTIVVLVTVAVAGNWPQWRGPRLNGVSDEKNLPLRWDTKENIAWKLALPGLSASTPVIWGEKIFLNVPEGNQSYLWCVDKRQGSLIWKKSLPTRAGEARIHPKHNSSSPSPVTDGKNVYVLNAYGTLRSFDFAGNEVWTREIQQDYGRLGLRFGYASSPLLFEDSLYIQVLREPPNAPSYILRVEKQTGKTLWKMDFQTSAGYKAADSYSTPTILRRGKMVELVINGSDQVTGHDLTTGRELWRVDGLSPESPPSRVVSSPVVADDIIYAPASFRPLVAFRAGGRGNITESHRIWSSRNGPDIPSPVTDGKYFYIVNDKGIMRCLDARTGKEIYGPQRLKPGDYSSSPVLADNKIYIVNEEGLTTVVKAGPGFEIMAENSLDDRCLSSPAISGGQLFIRTARFLYCIGKRSGSSYRSKNGGTR